ncbi:hypothetical protein EUA93_01640 [Nocardioides oleivorans]|uniref:Uncharacterized protein n=1 Tax=Nocardioides oleivorans TaxID=273676 RepID=A0A4Q2RVG6_9ACTN|nr:hypothetical protein [Nocardioides oleivorans]RYB93170.1 hypothetical protein EUA93_01640 [Nocardioides oleivorans]
MVLLTTAACGDDSSGGAAGGAEALPAVGDAAISGTDTYVQLPHGRVELTVSDPEALDPDLVEPGSDDGLADDQQVIGVDWEFVPSEGVPDDVTGFVIADDVPATVSVVVGDEEYALGDAYSVAGGSSTGTTAAFVPVGSGDDLDDVRVDVDFDGVRLGVGVGSGERTPAGAGELYADEAGPTDLACEPSLEPASVSGRLTCTVAARSLAWVSDLGWADDGSTWWVVDAYTGARDLRDGSGGRYGVTAMEDASTVADSPADATLLTDFLTAESALRTQQVFAGDEASPPAISLVRTLTWSEQDAGSLTDGDPLRLVADVGTS